MTRASGSRPARPPRSRPSGEWIPRNPRCGAASDRKLGCRAMPTPLRRAALAAAALCLVLPSAARARTTTDFAATALNIIPSGQQGAVPVPAGADRQARMYDALTPKFDDVTSADLHRDFKSERFGTSGECPCPTECVPRDGVRVVRDRFDVPHVTAKTVDAMTFTAGWISGEDR